MSGSNDPVAEMIAAAVKACWEVDGPDVPYSLDHDGVEMRYAGLVGVALEQIGLPLETLAALKDRTWQAVPANPTQCMRDAVCLSIEVHGKQASDLHWGMALGAAPEKPEAGQ